MGGFLLDTNVLIALSWPSHTSYFVAQRWFERNAKEGWATCPLTECAFVRVVSNPAFSPHALSVSEAARLLSSNLNHPMHKFFADNLNLLAALKGTLQNLTGHQQITDAYLLGLAAHHKSKFATLDRGVVGLGSSASVELIH